MSNKMMKKATACALSAVMAFGLVAVTDTATTTNVSAATKKVKKLAFKKKGYVIKKGHWMNVKIRLNFTPKQAKTTKLIYKTSNKKVATVSKTGILRAKKNGTVTITVIAKNNKKAKATTTVTVGKVVKSLKFKEGTKKTVYVGKSFTLHPKYSPKDASTKAVTWKSSNTKVATVSSKGKVVAKKAGKATITATAKDAGKKKANFKVTVKKKATPAATTKKVTLKPTVSNGTATISGIDANAVSYLVSRKGTEVKFTAAEVKEILGYIANPASAYQTWLDTTSRIKAPVAKITGTKGSNEKTVILSNTKTQYDGTYNVTVTKAADGYKVVAVKDGVEHVINVTVASNGDIKAESAKYVLTCDKNATSVVITNKETQNQATVKKADGKYTITLPESKAADLTIVQEVTVK